MPRNSVFTRRSKLGFILALVLVPNAGVAEGSEKVLHVFRGGTDGSQPGTGLAIGPSQTTYGTTFSGGDTSCPDGRGKGCGVVFEMDKRGKERVLYAFVGGDNDGAAPDGGLAADSAGNYYGVTASGGPNDAGTVFKVAPDGTESIVYAFQGGADGNGPIGVIARDGSGNLYGTANLGGNSACSPPSGCGTVFEVSPGGTPTVLHTFQGGTDGELPEGGLIADSSGNLYGTTLGGGNGAGCGSLGCGTVFQVAPDGTETILHAFQAKGSDGIVPVAGLLLDGDGNVYGTTTGGGTYNAACEEGCGTVFEIAADGSETVLYSFQSGSDGAAPEAGVVMDSAGNLYGTTYAGGGVGCKRSQGCGTVFKLTPSGKESVLVAFHGGHDGARPVAPLLLVGNKLYGTTLQGGKHHNGVMFELKK